MKKYVSFIMILFLLFNACSISVLGLDDTQVVEYVTEDDFQELSHYDDAIYADIKNEIKAITATNTHSFSYPAGGTLYLDYTGSYNPFGGVTINRIVYLNRAMVSALEEIYNSQKAETFLEFLLAEGAGIVTSTLLEKIAIKIGIKSNAIIALIGVTISTLIFVIDNLDRWDFNHALDNSSTGKLKLSFCYYWDSIENIYFNYTNYEPWDDGMITVPDDYDYSWSAEIYDMREVATFCEHQFQNWTMEDSNCHVKICTKCSFEMFDEHSLAMVSGPIGELYHTMKCIDCNYTVSHPHMMKWISMSADTHKGTCTLCNYTKTESHAASYDNLRGLCKKCGYTGPISSIMSFLLT